MNKDNPERKLAAPIGWMSFRPQAFWLLILYQLLDRRVTPLSCLTT
ncbi:hypothetical protein [Bradyrhizobium sp. BR 1432]